MKNCLFLLEGCPSAWLHWTQGISSSGIDILFGFGAAQDCLSQQLMKTSILPDLQHRSQRILHGDKTREQQNQKHKAGRVRSFNQTKFDFTNSGFAKEFHLQWQQLVTKSSRSLSITHCSSKFPSNSFLTNPSQSF